MELRGLKSWEDPSKARDTHTYKTTSIARYQVRLTRTIHYSSDITSSLYFIRSVPADFRVHPPFQAQFAKFNFLIATAPTRKP